MQAASSKQPRAVVSRRPASSSNCSLGTAITSTCSSRLPCSWAPCSWRQMTAACTRTMDSVTTPLGERRVPACAMMARTTRTATSRGPARTRAQNRAPDVPTSCTRAPTFTSTTVAATTPRGAIMAPTVPIVAQPTRTGATTRVAAARSPTTGSATSARCSKAPKPSALWAPTAPIAHVPRRTSSPIPTTTTASARSRRPSRRASAPPPPPSPSPSPCPSRCASFSRSGSSPATASAGPATRRSVALIVFRPATSR